MTRRRSSVAGLETRKRGSAPMSEAENIERTPANKNPWYWLATVYGEQPEGARWFNFDEGTAAKNRIAWNRWTTQALSEERKAELIKKGVDPVELTPFDDTERAQFLKDFAARAGDPIASPPDPQKRISFERVEFARPVIFAWFVFAHRADFWSAAFSGDASFHQAAFSGDAYFFQAAFSGDAYFLQAAFSGDAIFSGAAFSGFASFLGTAFSGEASFIGAKFESRTSFAHAKFLKFAPDFRDAKLPEATEWHRATWPPPPQNKIAAQRQVYAYEKLKAEMERLKKHADEQFFFALELRARRALEPFLSLKWPLYFAYEKFGGYGQSVARPLISLAVVWAAGAGLFALLPAAAGWPLDYEDAARLSLVNLIPFLPYKPGEEVMKHLDAWVEWFGILQAISGAVLLFLFGLALRNMFRMK
jgi:hypothetical protein